MLQTPQNHNCPQTAPTRRYRSTTGEVTPAEIALCRTRPALALLLHLRMNHGGEPFPIAFATIGQEMAPCCLSPNAVREALARLIEADLVEAFDACPLPRQCGPGRKTTRLYAVKPFREPDLG